MAADVVTSYVARSSAARVLAIGYILRLLQTIQHVKG